MTQQELEKKVARMEERIARLEREVKDLNIEHHRTTLIGLG